MSVMMGLRITADPGCIHHRFFVNEADGEVLVVDEWRDAASFVRFFESSPDAALVDDRSSP